MVYKGNPAMTFTAASNVEEGGGIQLLRTARYLPDTHQAELNQWQVHAGSSSEMQSAGRVSRTALRHTYAPGVHD